MQEQRHTAELLYERLCMAQRIADPTYVTVYGQLIEEADKLVRYFDEMSKTVEDMGEQLEQLSLKIRTMLKKKELV